MSGGKDSFLKQIKYFGINNPDSAYFIQRVCEEISSLKEIASTSGHPIETIEDVYEFLWLSSFLYAVDGIDNYRIEEGLKSEIRAIAASVVLPKSSLINYVNQNYQTLFDKRNHEDLSWVDFFTKMLELCYGTYSGGIKPEVFRFLEKAYPLHILCNYESCSNYYSNNETYFKVLFEPLKKSRVFDDQIYRRFLENAADCNNAFLKEQATFICERTVDQIERMKISSDDENIIYIQDQLVEYAKIAKLYKLKCVYRYSALSKKLVAILDEFIKKHGVHHTIGPVDLQPAIEILKKEQDPYKFLLLTHKRNDDQNLVNCFDDILAVTNSNNPLSEAFNDLSRKRSDKYPYYKQDYMNYSFWIRNRLINMVFQDEQLTKEFLDYLYNISLQIQKNYFESNVDIEKEIDAIADSIVGLMDFAKKDLFDTPYCRMLVYSLSLSTCATIEKIIRNVAFKEANKAFYYDFSKASLGELFKKPFELKDISKGLRYYLEFYMIREVNYKGLDVDKPGLNLRNDLMHGSDDSFEKTNYGTLLTLFNLLLSVINDIALSIKGESE